MNIKLYRFLTLAILTFACACSSEVTKTKNELTQTDKSVEKSENSETIVFTEPIEFTGIQGSDKVPENIRNAWQKFTSNGQYRLAQPSDMTFSESAKSQLPGQGKSPIVPYVYVWGELNYQKSIEDDHLAAIFVDTTKNSSDKFSLVIFSPRSDKKDEYDINWLYRNQDLSKTTVHGASGELHVAQYSDDGSREECSVVWNKKLKKFECL